MALYEYIAKDHQGKTVSGVIEASVQATVIELLGERSLIPISVTERTRRSILEIKFAGRVGIKDVVLFLRQLAVLVSATVPVVQALRILMKQTTNEQMQETLSQIVEDVDGGARLSQAFARHPKVFNDFYVNMIKSGETSGKLEEVLTYLADQKEKDYDLMSKVRGAMIYPAFVLTSMIGVGAIMMTFVVPKLTAVLRESATELPFTTKILISVSGFFAAWWWGILIVVGVLVLGIHLLYRTRPGKRIGDRIVISIPIFGTLIQKIILVRFTRNLGTLLHGDVPVPEALSLTAGVVGNAVYQSIIREAVARVEDGDAIAATFLEHAEIPMMLSHMMSIGEQTGKLDQILEKITQFYEREIQNLVANLVSLIEPLIMVVMGVAVGVMVSAIIMPMYNLANSL